MTVVQSYVCGHYYPDEKSQPRKDQLPSHAAKLLTEAVAINSTYNSMIVEPTKAGERLQQLGNKTECGLLGFVRQLSAGDYEEIRKRHPEETHVKCHTFNSSRKAMITVVELESGADRRGYRVFCKGASEILLSKLVGGGFE